MDKLDKTIQSYYLSQSLPDERISALLAMGKTDKNIWLPKLYLPLAAAAVLIICMVAGIQVFKQPTTADRIFAEITTNHLKHLPIEAAATQFQVLQKKLDRLDFAITPTQMAKLGNLSLVGGRYCSIQGQLAAQLKFRSPSSKNDWTLYITNMNESLRDVAPAISSHNHVRIQLWEDDGRFFGLAETMPGIPVQRVK